MDQYAEIRKIGEGAFGQVLLAKQIATGQLVALKKVYLQHYGDDRGQTKKPTELLPTIIVREIEALRQLEHRNVVRLLDVFPEEAGGGPSLVLVFEYMATDLAKVIKSSIDSRLPEAQIKAYMQMLLRALAHCHKHSVMHRDLKPSNLLIDHTGQLRLGDFGLARVCRPPDGARQPLYTNQIATRWYKAPELLFGARTYTPAVDMWGVGCILGELLANSPLFRGETDIDQLYRIVQVLGAPTDELWPGVSKLPDFNKITFDDKPPVPWRALLPDAPPEALELLSKFLVYDPDRRITAEAALVDAYFFTEPLPAHSSQLLQPHIPAHNDKADRTFDVNSPLRLIQ